MMCMLRSCRFLWRLLITRVMCSDELCICKAGFWPRSAELMAVWIWIWKAYVSRERKASFSLWGWKAKLDSCLCIVWATSEERWDLLYCSCSFPFPVGRNNRSADSVFLPLFHVEVANPSLQRTCTTISQFLMIPVTWLWTANPLISPQGLGNIRAMPQHRGSFPDTSEWFGMDNKWFVYVRNSL